MKQLTVLKKQKHQTTWTFIYQNQKQPDPC